MTRKAPFRGFFSRSAILAACALAGLFLGETAVLRARALDPSPRDEEARALDRVLPRALARIGPSLLRVRPESVAALDSKDAASVLARKTRTAIALSPDLAVMDASSVEATGKEGLVVLDRNGRVRKAKLGGRDARLRLVAVLVEEGGLVPAPRSERLPVPGTFVVAAGVVFPGAVSPAAVIPGKPSATFGIVSAPTRFEGRAIQVDAGIDPANAGGALVDLEGALVGVPVLVDRKLGDDSGVGFAVPVSRIEPVLARLGSGEDLKPAMLGIQLPPEEPKDAPGGVKIEAVMAGGPASQAGIERDDVITTIAERAVRSIRDLVVALAEHCGGDEVDVVVSRKGVETTKRVRLGSRK